MSKKPSRKVQAPQVRMPRSGTRLRPIVLAAAAIVLVGVAGFLVVPRGSTGGGTPVSAPRSGPAPSFAERDVVSGAALTSDALRGRNVLLFFSEGVMCQACFQEIQALQANANELKKRRLLLVSITTDTPDVLREAAQAYGITTPLVSDDNKDMSRTYDVLGQGMHPDTAGHTFVLVDRRGNIRWRRDYTTMYVGPSKLFAELPAIG